MVEANLPTPNYLARCMLVGGMVMTFWNGRQSGKVLQKNMMMVYDGSVGDGKEQRYGIGSDLQR